MKGYKSGRPVNLSHSIGLIIMSCQSGETMRPNLSHCLLIFFFGLMFSMREQKTSFHLRPPSVCPHHNISGEIHHITNSDPASLILPTLNKSPHQKPLTTRLLISCSQAALFPRRRCCCITIYSCRYIYASNFLNTSSRCTQKKPLHCLKKKFSSKKVLHCNHK